VSIKKVAFLVVGFYLAVLKVRKKWRFWIVGFYIANHSNLKSSDWLQKSWLSKKDTFSTSLIWVKRGVEDGRSASQLDDFRSISSSNQTR